MTTGRSRTTTWVVKVSKLCNLRCAYCYEMDELGDSSRMVPSALVTLFQRVLEVSDATASIPSFLWHGGEPLLLPATFYQDVFRLQRKVFKDQGYRPENSIQTNLTVWSAETAELLRTFDHVSVSIDLIGGLRVDAGGNQVQSRITTNMARLAEAKISFGAVTVLSKQNVAHVDDIFRFFNNAGISFRVLPIYRYASSFQIESFAISAEMIATAFTRFFDLWLREGKGIAISPLDTWISAAVRYSSGSQNDAYRYRKAEAESVYMVNTNGDIYSVADAYKQEFCYGNIFRDDTAAIISSVGRQRAISASLTRQQDACDPCPYFGSCSGFPMAEATELERYVRAGRYECTVVRPVIDHVVKFLQTRGRKILNRTPDAGAPAWQLA
jgi:uncharacterized protein